MLGFESLQNEVSNFLGVTRKPTKPVTMTVKLDFPKGYEGGVNAFKRYYNSLSTNYELNPFIGITYLPPVKSLNELSDHINIPQNLQEEYTKLYNKYQQLLRYLNIVYIEPKYGNIHQYYAGEYIYGLGQPVSAVFKRVYAEIQRLLELRKLMIAEYYKLINRMTEIENSEREIPIIEDECVVVDIRDSDLYGWTMSYISNTNAYERGPSYIIADEIIKIEGETLDDVRSFQGSEITSVRFEVCKGVDFLTHNLLTKGFRNTLLDLYPTIVKELKPDGVMTAGWIEKVRLHFDLPEVMGGMFYQNLFNFFSYIKNPELKPGEANNYTARCRLLTDVLIAANGGVYGYDCSKNIKSSLALFVKYRRTGLGISGWRDVINVMVEQHINDGKKVIFRCIPTDNGQMYENAICILIEDDPDKIEIGPPVETKDTKLLEDNRNPVNKFLQVRKKRRLKYFGDYRYHIDTSMYQEKGWIDNRNSGNLCSITALVMNKRFRDEMDRRGIDVNVLIAEAVLLSNVHSDIRLFKVTSKKMLMIHEFIRNRTGYNFNVRYHTVTETGNRTVDGRLVTGFNGDKKDIYDVVKVSGHVFLISDKEHLKYILEKADPRTARVSEAPKYNILDQVRFDTLLGERLRNKTLLHDIIGTEFGRDECMELKYYPIGTLTSYISSSMGIIETCIDNEYNGTKLISELKKIPIDYFREYAVKKLMSNEADVKTELKAIKKNLNALRRKVVDIDNLQYGTMDMETRNNDKERAVCYGLSYNIFDDSRIIDKGNIHNLHISDNRSEEDLIYCYMLRMVGYLESKEAKRMRIFAHNGGKFDTQILKQACTKIKNKKLGKFDFTIDTEIKSGGRIKLFNVSFSITEEVEDVEYVKSYRLEFVDSVVLLEAPIEDMERVYGLTGCKKGAYPYLFYRYLIVDLGRSKMIWTRDELLAEVERNNNEGKKAEKEDLLKFLNETKNKNLYDFIQVFEEYCDQDVNIAAKGLIKANEMYSKINIDVLGDKGRGIVMDKNLKISRIRLLDSVTLSSLSKKMMKYKVLSKSGFTYKGIDYEYLKCYTGGLTFINKVQTVESSIIKEIAKNPYFYIDNVKRNEGIKKLFVEKYGYDPNKPFLKYDRANPPAEVLNLQKLMVDTDGACILLLDANSLYPSAIYAMLKQGGFPIGAFTKFTGNKIPAEAKRWIGYAKIKWSEAALECDTDDFPMHPLIINTKTGNRHLTPADEESNYFGLSDIMYKSVMETRSELYEIEIINGVYWKETSNEFSEICKQMYEERKKYKNGVVLDSGEVIVEKNEVLSDCIKKVMNSFYGVLLEKCHSEMVTYLYKLASVKMVPDLDEDCNEIFHVVNVPSDKQNHKDKKGEITDYVDINNYSRATTIDINKVDSYTSSVQFGVFVLDMSKYIMNQLFNALGWDILYTDTDSAFFTNDQYNKIKELKIEGNDLIGPDLGQFKPDFDDKYTKGRGEKGQALNDDYGIVSILSIFNGKKNYCNVLFGQSGNSKESYLSVCMQSACKGVLHKEFSIQDYIEMNNNNKIMQNFTDSRVKFVNEADGPHIYNKGAGYEFWRSVTNSDMIWWRQYQEHVKRQARKKIKK